MKQVIHYLMPLLFGFILYIVWCLCLMVFSETLVGISTTKLILITLVNASIVRLSSDFVAFEKRSNKIKLLPKNLTMWVIIGLAILGCVLGQLLMPTVGIILEVMLLFVVYFAFWHFPFLKITLVAWEVIAYLAFSKKALSISSLILIVLSIILSFLILVRKAKNEES